VCVCVCVCVCLCVYVCVCVFLCYLSFVARGRHLLSHQPTSHTSYQDLHRPWLLFLGMNSGSVKPKTQFNSHTCRRYSIRTKIQTTHFDILYLSESHSSTTVINSRLISPFSANADLMTLLRWINHSDLANIGGKKFRRSGIRSYLLLKSSDPLARSRFADHKILFTRLTLRSIFAIFSPIPLTTVHERTSRFSYF
jgi:hypothetical protein